MQLIISNSKESLAAEFAHQFQELTESKDKIHVALSGGSTPKVVFDYLAKHLALEIDWSKVRFYWGDERCVPPSDPESNYKMTVDHLISKIEIPATNIFRVLGENNPSEEAIRYGKVLDQELPKENEIPQFDLVMLGMGDDGHTASIFPDSIQLWDSVHNCVVATHPDSGQKRVTITGKIINNAKRVALLVTGASKAEKLREIVKQEGDFRTYPASLVNPATADLIWYVDQEAAKEVISKP
ncbi:6-phosphogluconolactonase [Algoriphagus marinus]|uniref:6-phosphogluconolactonase n=1 Tax=Algoriphagus marinus TaxID=1925762 RepID=UPI00094B915A|nr:6-phosphogluconolactonase [Algoriphagus marinus]